MEGAAAQKESHGGDSGIAGAAKKVGGLQFGGRGRLTCNQPQYAALPPDQIVPPLADQGLYNSYGEAGG